MGEIVRVVRAMESPEDPFAEIPASELGKDVVRPMWMDLQGEVMDRLENISVDDLCMRAYQGGLPSEASSKMDFTI